MAKLRAQHHRGGDANKATSEERQAIKYLQEGDIENALGRAAWVVKYENLNKVRDKLVIMLDTLGRKHNKVTPNVTPEDIGIAEIVYSIMYLAKELDADRKGDNKRTELQDIAYNFARCWGKSYVVFHTCDFAHFFLCFALPFLCFVLHCLALLRVTLFLLSVCCVAC